jgi:3-oxoacyl-(acyl-carrier-protein) synthase
LSKVFVTGMGVISAIGNTLAENHEALISGRCGIRHSTALDSRRADKLLFGEVSIDTETLAKEISDGSQDGRSLRCEAPTRTTLLALHALQEAILDARLSRSQYQAFDTALVGATTVGGMCLMDELYRDVHRGSDGSPFLASYEAASVCRWLQSHYRINGIVNTINTACSSSANAIMYGARLIRNGLARRAIVGGVDSLSKFTVNGFNSLHILSPAHCTPFDKDRSGLNLGEGAAFIILEREEDLGDRQVYAELSGYGNANDAFHPSSLSDSGDGPYLAMEEALASARLNAGQIDYINAHGTGTGNNDEVESVAMLRLFGEPPPFSSTKSNIGHTLGASGAIEAVYSILNLAHQEVYAGLHFREPIPATGLRPVTTYKKLSLQHVMSNSFGFGGNCSSLIFSKA